MLAFQVEGSFRLSAVCRQRSFIKTYAQLKLCPVTIVVYHFLRLASAILKENKLYANSNHYY